MTALLALLTACTGAVGSSAAPPPSVAGADAPPIEPSAPDAGAPSTSITAVLFERGALARKSDQVYVAPGTTVILAVSSDVADDVHVHGYDRVTPTNPGSETRLTFNADRPGRFTAELESRAVTLVEFVVDA